MEHLWTEAYRLRLMQGLEQLLHDSGFGWIAGVDEVGRGALAGPVVAAAVLVGPGPSVPGVDDSKHLRPEQRERLAKAIRAVHPVYRAVAVPPAEIDRLNILEATRLAMRRALDHLSQQPEVALIDAVSLRGLAFPSLPVVRGDQISYSIACASILAKVERDRMMCALEDRYPAYGLAENKGYGTAEHRRALSELGPCPAHRLTFRSVLPRLSAAEVAAWR